MTGKTGGIKKTRKVTVRVVWTEEMDRAVFDYIRSGIQSGKHFEKPSAPDYYRRFLEGNADGFDGVTLDKLVQRMKSLRRSYTSAKDWKNRTGQGILSENPENGPMTVEAEVLRRCKWFKEFDEVLGDKPQITPPLVLHSFDDISEIGNLEQTHDVDDYSMGIDSETDTGEKVEITTAKKDTWSIVCSPRRKKARCTSATNAADALESAMRLRTSTEEKRLEWEKQVAERNQIHLMESTAREIRLQEARLNFEKEKWQEELNIRRLQEEHGYELEKLRIESQIEIEKFRIEKEYELEKMKLP